MSEAVRSEYRFAPVPEALLYDPTITPMAVRVYAVLARHGMTPESCYPSHALIAERCGCSPRSVQRPLRELEEAGWITRVPRFDERGDRRSDGFIVRVEPALPDAPPASQNAHPTASQDADPPRSGTRKKESHENESHEGTKTHEREPRSDGSSDALIADLAEARRRQPAPSAFDEFWSVYPLRRSKGPARIAWAKALKKADADTILAGAVAYRDDPNRREGFTQYPATWLNGECWNDDPLPARGDAAQAGPRSAITYDRSAPSGKLSL